MAFKNFRLVTCFQIGLLAGSIALLLYLLSETELYATTGIVGIVIIMQIWGLVHYVDKSNRDLARFLLSVRHGDFTSAFPPDGRGGSHRELREVFDNVLRDFRKTRSEKEEQYRYLQTVVQHIGIGLIAFDSEGNVDLINNAAKRLLGVTVVRNIEAISKVSPELVEKMSALASGQRDMLKADIQGEMLQLSLAATEFRLGQRHIKLVSLQDIASELAEREMEAWQQLVRVLTHEIMNSVTPIASLSATAETMLDVQAQDANTTDPGVRQKVDFSDIRRAVFTIKKRSEGLLHFVDAYRTLTRIPKPEFQIVSVLELLERIGQLATSHPAAKGITITASSDPVSLELTADPDLIEQVLINLTTNAIQALKNQDNGKIDLTARLTERGRVILQVSNNGPGIGEDAQESIFVPFFTTKPEGSGIGLSLSRQVMRLHKGEISVSSAPGEPTVFSLRF